MLYIDDRNLLTWHEERLEADADVLEVVQAHPSLAADFGYFSFDGDGQRVGEFISGADLLTKRGAAA
jgi:hypothetical protein